MKKLIGSILAVVALASVGQAANLIYQGVMPSAIGPAGSPAAASTATYVHDVDNNGGGDLISAQIIYASATIAPVAFTDGSVSTFTLTVVSTQGIVGIRPSDTLTVLTTWFAKPSFINVNGFYVPTSGFRIDATSNTAIDAATALGAVSGVSTATVSGSVVTVKLSTGSWANGQVFSIVGTSSITVSSPTFQGGQNAAVVSINGLSVTAGVDYAVGSTVGATATNIAAALNARADLSPLVNALAIGAVVTSTSDFVGPGYAITTSTQSALTIGPFTSSSPLTGFATGAAVGGTSSAYTIQTPTITVSGHGLQTGVEVFLSTGSGVALSPLVTGTTYYAIRIDANNFGLATTAANAAAGTFTTLTSSRTNLTADTFTLTQSPMTGAAVFRLDASNDGVNWTPVTLGENGATLSAVNFATPWTAGSTLWDIGRFDHRYLRLFYGGPTLGSVNFSLNVNEKGGSTAR